MQKEAREVKRREILVVGFQGLQPGWLTVFRHSARHIER